MSTPLPETYFVDGGTLRPDTPSYVKRPADRELFDALMDHEFCYILTPRQMGKSSLMIHTSQLLKEHNIKTAIVDIQGIGTSRIKEWYASLLSQIRRGLKLSVDIDEWMKQKSNVGFGQLFRDFIQDIILAKTPEQVVIFLDEVDWMIKIDFRDDFFASIRSIYNARALYPEFNRISIVLLGVASPADLIAEPTRTPFNIGHAIPLQELSLEDATPLQNGLEQVCPGEGYKILQRIFYWTNGHPYLTQKICKTIAETGKAKWSDNEVDELVDRLFLSEESRKESNLKFIQDRILSNEQYADLLKLYLRVRNSKIKENGQSVAQNQLMLSGLLTSRNGYLQVRNRIYQTVFNERWINQNTPKNWQKVALVTMSSLVVLLLAVLGYNYTVSLRLKTYQTDYIRGDPAQKMAALANIYGLRYLFSSNTDIDATAAQAFYEFTPDSKTQISLFPPYGVDDPAKQKDMIIVIGKLYVTLGNVEEDNDNTSLLQAMDTALHHTDLNNGIGIDLQQELDNWIRGRTGYKNKDYVTALAGYNDAISINPGNQATLYERARVYLALGQFENALEDLDAAIGAAKQSAPDIPPSPTPTISPLHPSETPYVTPTVGATPTSISQSPTLASVPPGVVTNKPDRFESNFTTFNHVIVAIKALIENTPELQIAMQSNGESRYSNLQTIGPVSLIFPTQTMTSISEPLRTSTPIAQIVSVECGSRLTLYVHIRIANESGISSYSVWSTWGGGGEIDQTFSSPLPTVIDQVVEHTHAILDPVDRQHQVGLKVTIPDSTQPIYTYALEPDGRCPGHYQPPSPLPSLQVTQVVLRADPVDYVGACPVRITFSGRISVNGSGTVSYKFLRSDGAIAPTQTLTFDGPGSQDISTTWDLGGSGMTYSGWEQIQILDPQSLTSNQAAFNIQCQ
jgi:tetratricopeptide (TPR) repeat protein